MLDFLAERRIAEAVSRGELDDDALVPEELRAAKRYYAKLRARLAR